MINIYEYLMSKDKHYKNVIFANDDNIARIVRHEIEKLGPEANLNHIDVCDVTNMSRLFSQPGNDPLDKYREKLNPDISEWNTSNVKNMSKMFWRCHSFNCDISGWDVSNVENMESMFEECYEFNQPIGNWDVSKVSNMHSMFWLCKKFNADISGWDMSNVKDMQSMLAYASEFDQDLSGWDVRNVEYFKLSPFKSPFVNTKIDYKSKRSKWPKFNWEEK